MEKNLQDKYKVTIEAVLNFPINHPGSKKEVEEEIKKLSKYLFKAEVALNKGKTARWWLSIKDTPKKK